MMQNNFTQNANIFRAFMLLGVAIAFYIYFINFNSLSEEELITWTPAWAFTFLFGYYGFVANRVLQNKDKTGEEKVFDTALDIIKAGIGNLAYLIIILLYIPLWFIRTTNAWLTAILATLFWAIALYLFFEHVFPYL